MKNIVVNEKNQLIVDLNEMMPSSKRQQYTVNEYLKQGNVLNALEYMRSFKTTRKDRKNMSVNRLVSRGHDILINKGNGNVLRRLEELQEVDDATHKPLTNKHRNWIGVEIECFIPFNAKNGIHFDHDTDECSECDGRGNWTDDDGDEQDCSSCEGSGTEHCSTGLKALARYFKKQKVTRTSVKYDGSLEIEDSSYFAAEITVLTELNDPKNLMKACKILNDLGAVVNRSCGMHVHLDARHLGGEEVREVGAKFKKCLPVLGSMVPKTRRNNTRYCKMGVSELDGNRYFAVNLTAFEKYGTVEIRLHSSTTDFDKIINWSRLLNAIMISEVKFNRVCRDLNTLTDFIKIDESLLEYFGQRIALFTSGPISVNDSAIDHDDADAGIIITNTGIGSIDITVTVAA